MAADRSRWIAGRSAFLFPVRALSTVFRAKYLAGLQHAFDAGQLTFAGGTAGLVDRPAFASFLGRLREGDWVVYAKRPFAGPEQVLDYLGRYTHRVALSNDRLVAHHDGRVQFRWQDYADHAPTNSCVAFSCTSCRVASCASATSVCSRIGHDGNRLTQCRGLLGQPPTEARASP